MIQKKINEAFNRIDYYNQKKQNFFLTLFTVSTHRPYLSPTNKTPSLKSVYDYAGKEVARFYDFLKSKDYFDNGILIVVGDHRRMELIPQYEFEHYGDLSRNWVWLSLFGKNTSEKISNLYISQHELISSMLAYANLGEATLKERKYISFTNPNEQDVKLKNRLISIDNKPDLDSKIKDRLRNAASFVRYISQPVCAKFLDKIRNNHSSKITANSNFRIASYDNVNIETFNPNNLFTKNFLDIDYQFIDKLKFDNNIKLHHLNFNLNSRSTENLNLRVNSASRFCLYVDGRIKLSNLFYSKSPITVPVRAVAGLNNKVDLLIETNESYLKPQIEYTSHNSNAWKELDSEICN